MIEIRGKFTPWHEATREKALKLFQTLYQRIAAISGGQKRADYINRTYLRRVKFRPEDGFKKGGKGP